MKFYVVLLAKVKEAKKASKSSFYVTSESIESAIEKAKSMLKSYEVCEEAYFVSRTDGPGFSWTNPKYIVGA